MIIVNQRLKYDHAARIHWPTTVAEKQVLADLVHVREPFVRDVIGFTDGVSLPVKCASDVISQATDYNGYHTVLSDIRRQQ